MAERKWGIWSCKIGQEGSLALPLGADAPMRQAVAEAYRKITGVEPQFIFSGWNVELEESELAVIEDRMPRVSQESATGEDGK